jgi:glycosyltransferase involved in cell wall biosynthesis
MEDRLVSVALCTYNGAKYIQEQIESILQQTYSNLEIIVVDDCSKDDTIGIVKSIAEKDARVQYFVNETNLGYNLNFEKACKLCKGNFISISDQDDVWELDKIEKLLKKLTQKPETVLVHSMSANFKADGKTKLRSLKLINFETGSNVLSYMVYNSISGHNMLFKRSLLTASLPFITNVYYDWWLVVQACGLGKIEHLPEILSWHRVHDQNITGAKRPPQPYHEMAQVNIQHFLSVKNLPAPHVKIMQQFKTEIDKYPLPNNKFSWSMFWLLLKNSKSIFAQKKRFFPFWTRFKNSYRIAAHLAKA